MSYLDKERCDQVLLSPGLAAGLDENSDIATNGIRKTDKEVPLLEGPDKLPSESH